MYSYLQTTASKATSATPLLLSSEPSCSYAAATTIRIAYPTFTMPEDITKTWVYPRVDSDQDIDGKKGLVKAMPLLYGPNYDSVNFNPLFTNIRTGALMMKTHHCTYNDKNGHKMTRRCISDLHQAYCIEFIDVVIDGVKYRVRCGARLKVESGGCGTHPANTMANSKNLMIKNLVAGKVPTISWNDLNDTEEDTAIVSAKDDIIKAMKDMEIKKHDSFEVQQDDPTAYQPPHIAFEQLKQAQDRAMAEERKAAAAAKRSNASNVFGKMKKAANFFTDKDETSLDKKGRQYPYKPDCRKVKPTSDKFKNKRGGKNVGKGGL
jgi:hypothetical protein